MPDIKYLFKLFLSSNPEYNQVIQKYKQNFKKYVKYFKNILKLYRKTNELNIAIELENIKNGRAYKYSSEAETLFEKVFPELAAIFHDFQRFIQKYNEINNYHGCMLDIYAPLVHSHPLTAETFQHKISSICSECIKQFGKCTVHQYISVDFEHFLSFLISYLSK